MPQEDRLDRLERIVLELAEGQLRLQESQVRTADRLSATVERLSEEMREFKEEMRKFKEEMRKFMEEMRKFQEEMRLITKRLDRAWGDLANRLGTILEDIAAPNIERFAMQEFGFASVRDLLVRVRRTSRIGTERQREFDVICTGAGKVIYAEMKTKPDLRSLGDLKDRLKEFFDFFPEYSGYELIGVYASWALEKSMRVAISSQGLYGVAMGDDTMQVVARPYELS